MDIILQKLVMFGIIHENDSRMAQADRVYKFDFNVDGAVSCL
jgi:hypothetical protein